MRTAMIMALVALAALTSACKSEKEKMVEEWEAKACSAKDHETASKERFKYEKWIDEKGWTDKEIDARQAAFERVTKCVEKLEKK